MRRPLFKRPAETTLPAPSDGTPRRPGMGTPMPPDQTTRRGDASSPSFFRLAFFFLPSRLGLPVAIDTAPSCALFRRHWLAPVVLILKQTSRIKWLVQGLFPLLPLHGAEFAGLESFDYPQGFSDRAAYVVVRDGLVANHALGIDDECSAKGHTLILF